MRNLHVITFNIGIIHVDTTSLNWAQKGVLMGDLTTDIERCLGDCVCDEATADRARSCCEEGRMRETKRVLLEERSRLVDEMHASQRGIDTIDHLLARVATEMQVRRRERP